VEYQLNHETKIKVKIGLAGWLAGWNDDQYLHVGLEVEEVCVWKDGEEGQENHQKHLRNTFNPIAFDSGSDPCLAKHGVWN